MEIFAFHSATVFSAPSTNLRRACDECKRRKRKCDTKPPQCSLCAGSNIECRYSIPRRRGRKPRVRATSLDGHPGVAQRDNSHDAMITEDSRVASLMPTSQRTQDLAQRVLSQQSNDRREEEVVLTPASSNWSLQALTVHQLLVHATKGIGIELDTFAEGCIDLFMQRCFPTFPLISPSLLREKVHLLLPSASYLFTTVPYPTTPGHDQQGTGIVELRAYCLLTALCAFMCQQGDACATGHHSELVGPLLQASRQMLLCWEDQDVRYPDSSSMIIRILHAAALHALGKKQLSWYTMGQAQRIALAMRLYDEESFVGVAPVESQLRRNVFWVLYIADKSAYIMADVPTTFHEIGLTQPLTTKLLSQTEPCLIDREKDEYAWPFERQLQGALPVCFRIWNMATDLLLDMKIWSRIRIRSDGSDAGESTFAMSMMRSYMKFNNAMDTLPAWLRNPLSHIVSNDMTTAFQRQMFWIQRADLVITYHCLRFKILQSASQQGFCTLLGITDNEEMLALHMIEITQDLLAACEEIPFEALLANGEPLVEKFRQLGIKLLEIAAKFEGRSISHRARSLFSNLIDVIARLNSRVSDELTEDVVLL